MFKDLDDILQLPKGKLYALILLPVLIYIVGISVLACNVPYVDDCPAILGYVSQDFHSRMTHIFDFHNEHRIVMTRLIAEFSLFLFDCVDMRFFILIGSLMNLGLLFLLFRRFDALKAKTLFIPCIWLVLDWFNWENPLWAMTAIQNLGVLFFAYLAINFACNRVTFENLILSISFALLTTLCSGQGLLIWPCLVCVPVKKVLLRKYDSAILCQLIVYVIGTLITAFLYLHNFPNHTDASSAFAFLNAIDFVISYCGGACPVHLCSFILGLVILGTFLYLIFNLRSVSDDKIFAFAAFLIGTILAGACKRSSDIGLVIVFRYCIISSYLFLCWILLLPTPKSKRISTIFSSPVKRKLFYAIGMCAIFINLGSLILGFPKFYDRKLRMEKGIMEFPLQTSNLIYQPFPKDTSIKALTDAVSCGRYHIPCRLNVKAHCEQGRYHEK